jgi:hypothetical protein
MLTDTEIAAIAKSVSAEQRLATLESEVGELRKPKPKPGKDGWDKFSALTPLISGILLAIVGYFLTGSVNNALKRQEVQLSNVREMRELLARLQGPAEQLKVEEAEGAAFTLAAFGAPAVAPLITVLTAGDDVRAVAAEKALRAIGFSDPAVVCRPMLKIVDNHTGRFSWIVHKHAIRLIGDLECSDAGPVLAPYSALVKKAKDGNGLAEYQRIVDSSMPIDIDGVTQLDEEVERALRITRAHR